MYVVSLWMLFQHCLLERLSFCIDMYVCVCMHTLSCTYECLGFISFIYISERLFLHSPFYCTEVLFLHYAMITLSLYWSVSQVVKSSSVVLLLKVYINPLYLHIHFRFNTLTYVKCPAWIIIQIKFNLYVNWERIDKLTISSLFKSHRQGISSFILIFHYVFFSMFCCFYG